MEKLKIALFVDVENFLEPLQLFGQFTNGLRNYGKISNKIAIGGWGFLKHLENWRDLCIEQNIKMKGYNGFKGKNAADRSIVAMATAMILDNQCNAVAVYSRDQGFSIGFASLKVLGAKIIVPVINNESILDADIYIKTDKNKLVRSEPKTELGLQLMKALPDVFI